jgi:hypothetical protein
VRTHDTLDDQKTAVGFSLLFSGVCGTQDPPGEAEEEAATTDLHRRGLCLAPLSPAVVGLVSSAAMRGHRGDCWRQLGTLL